MGSFTIGDEVPGGLQSEVSPAVIPAYDCTWIYPSSTGIQRPSILIGATSRLESDKGLGYGRGCTSY